MIDFIPAISNITPITPSDSSVSGVSGGRSPLFLSVADGTNEEIARLHHQYTKLIHKNRK